jgi:hypothetical protein
MMMPELTIEITIGNEPRCCRAKLSPDEDVT